MWLGDSWRRSLFALCEKQRRSVRLLLVISQQPNPSKSPGPGSASAASIGQINAHGMEYFCQLCVVPTSPALVAELAPADPASAEIREHIRGLLTDLIEKDTAGENTAGENAVSEIVLVGSQDPQWRTAHRGSFRAWGAPQVQLADGYFLAELVLRYLCVEWEHLISASYPSLVELLTSHRLTPETVVLLGIDGSTGLGPRAPLAELPAAPAADRWARALLDSGSAKTNASASVVDHDADAYYARDGEAEPAGRVSEKLPAFTERPSSQQLQGAGIREPALWLELASLHAAGALTQMKLRHADVSHGVARYIATGQIIGRTGKKGDEVCTDSLE